MTKPARTYWLVMVLVTPIIRWWARAEVRGADLLLPAGPRLVIVNHDSHWDPLVVGVAASGKAQVRALAKSSLWARRPMAMLLNGMGQLPITRGRADRQELARAAATLAAGNCIGIFPEGTISDGRALRAFSGAGWLAGQAADTQIIAVAITGAVDIVRFPKRPKITVEFFIPRGGSRQPGESAIGVSRRVMAEIRGRAPVTVAGRRARQRGITSARAVSALPSRTL